MLVDRLQLVHDDEEGALNGVEALFKHIVPVFVVGARGLALLIFVVAFEVNFEGLVQCGPDRNLESRSYFVAGSVCFTSFFGFSIARVFGLIRRSPNAFPWQT